jgi:hypothetical protein
MTQKDPHLMLPVESAALLWCMRIWVAGKLQSIEVDARIERVLDTLGAAAAAPFIEGMMFAVGHGATRQVAVHCMCRPAISADEQALLDAVALAQEYRPFEALLLLRGFLSPEGARAAVCSAEGIGIELARVGRFLDAPSGSLQHFGLSSDPRLSPWAGA